MILEEWPGFRAVHNSSMDQHGIEWAIAECCAVPAFASLHLLTERRWKVYNGKS